MPNILRHPHKRDPKEADSKSGKEPRAECKDDEALRVEILRLCSLTDVLQTQSNPSCFAVRTSHCLGFEAVRWGRGFRKSLWAFFGALEAAVSS